MVGLMRPIGWRSRFQVRSGNSFHELKVKTRLRRIARRIRTFVRILEAVTSIRPSRRLPGVTFQKAFDPPPRYGETVASEACVYQDLIEGTVEEWQQE